MGSFPTYCDYCGHGNNQHATDCARDLPGAKEHFDRGYLDGRTGATEYNPDAHPAYRAGWCRGEVAAEEAYNGYNPSWDG